MNDLQKGIANKSPFKIWIKHVQGSPYDSYTLPLATRGTTGVPNLKWAGEYLRKYKNAQIAFAILYNNGREIGRWTNGIYSGQYLATY